MIALLATYLLIAYVLIPGVLFRFLVSFFVKLRLFQLTRTQEATFAVLVSALPAVLAWLLVWHSSLAGSFPFGAAGSEAERSASYARAATLALTSDASRLFEARTGTAGPGKLDPAYWRAVINVAEHQGRFLFWFYLLVLGEGAGFGLLARKHGDWAPKSKFYRIFARYVILRNVSEWQVLLTPFAWPRREARQVYVDVLMREAGLYQGRVADFFLDTNGKLSGIQLEEARRFRRTDYEAAVRRLEAAHGTPEPKNDGAGSDRDAVDKNELDREDYWIAIPGTNFYVPADQIINLNIRFPLSRGSDLRADLQRDLRELLDAPNLAADVTVEDDEYLVD